jgi:hypothetical protein
MIQKRGKWVLERVLRVAFKQNGRKNEGNNIKCDSRSTEEAVEHSICQMMSKKNVFILELAW